MFQVRTQTVKLEYSKADHSSKRIKGAIDQTIAQEQARQRLAQSSPSRSGSRSNSRNLSPSRRTARARPPGTAETPTGKGPDPAAFEPDFVIDDEEPSRSATPTPNAEGKTTGGSAEAAGSTANMALQPSGEDDPQRRSGELPTEVRVRLRKMDKLESRYQGGCTSRP